MEHVKLKPCPFCGSINLQILQDSKYQWFITCDGSDCPMNCEEWLWIMTKEEAITAWNKRIKEK